MRVLTPSQVADLADAIHPRFKALVLLAAYGGLRIGELAGLKRQNVDLLRGQVEVVETLVEVAGTLHTNPPKTRAGRRQVGIPKSLAQELQRHIQEYGHAGNDYVFTAPQGGPLRVPAFRSRFWQPAVKLAGLDGLTLHELRHTAVSLWISAGGNPTSIAARAGHTSAAFTHDRYGHMFPEDDLKLSETLETFIQSAHTIPG